MVVETKAFVPDLNKLRLSWAKLKLNYEEVLRLSCRKSWKGSYS